MPRIAFLVLSLFFTAAPIAAHDGSGSVADAGLHIAPGAAAAVQVLNRFSAALAKGDVAAATVYLAPDVLILETGGAEHSREQYLSGHARHDADFLKSAEIILKRRKADASGGLVWVGSESEIRIEKNGKPLLIHSTESAVLRKTSDGWRIVHLHWSSKSDR
ncbi:MAG: hypothetical protein RLZZ09_780 [Pseudomonadota bacterium]